MTHPQGFIKDQLLVIFKKWIAETIHEYSDNPDLMRIAIRGHMDTLAKMAAETDTMIDDMGVGLIRACVDSDTLWTAYTTVMQKVVAFLDGWLASDKVGDHKTGVGESYVVNALKANPEVFGAVKALHAELPDPKFGWEQIIILVAPYILEMIKKWWEKRQNRE